MLSDILLIASAFFVPLFAQRVWVAVLLALVGTAVSSMLTWNAGLMEDVPPVMLVFSAAVLLVVVPLVAVLVFRAKVWCLGHWQTSHNHPK
jgi:hypothetical protein